MVLRYCGHWVRINKEKWKALSFKGKLKCVGSYFLGQTEYLIDCLKEIPQNLKIIGLDMLMLAQKIFCVVDMEQTSQATVNCMKYQSFVENMGTVSGFLISTKALLNSLSEIGNFPTRKDFSFI